MSDAALPRSPTLMNPEDSALLVVDVQAKLAPLVGDARRLAWNVRRLIDGARLLDVAVGATEQYPAGLGPTLEPLAQQLPQRSSKLTFSCGSCGEIFESWQRAGRWKILVAGIETHVCVQQTVFDLLAAGYQAMVAVDAVASRHALDHEIALRRMEAAGAMLTTTEAALFEWCGTAGAPAFKALSQLVREAPPS